MDDAIVSATWGLVVVTALLVIATLVPFVGDLLKRRSERGVVAAKTVPDMNILRTRLEGAVRRLGGDNLAEEAVHNQVHSIGEELRMLAPIIDVREASLEFTNELFLVRHLLTFTGQSLDSALGLFKDESPTKVRERDKKIRDARRGYQAALLSLDAAEALLPRSQRLIGGEKFWDRFARVSDERENQAAQLLAQSETITRTNRLASE